MIHPLTKFIRCSDHTVSPLTHQGAQKGCKQKYKQNEKKEEKIKELSQNLTFFNWIVYATIFMHAWCRNIYLATFIRRFINMNKQL